MTRSDTPERDAVALVHGRKVGAGPLSPALRGEFTYSIIATESKATRPQDAKSQDAKSAAARSTAAKPEAAKSQAAKSQAAKSQDKRRNERMRTRLRAAHLADRRDKVIVDCLIQDRSRTGARLRLSLDRPLPKAFILSDEISRTEFWAELAWQRGRDAGVRFLSLPRPLPGTGP